MACRIKSFKWILITNISEEGSFMAKTDRIMMDHVSAAKKWLGKAENSLEHDNNIRSDLHIMLAEAELRRAREKMANTAKPFWLKYIAPLMMSVLVFAAGGFFLLNEHNHSAKAITVPPVVVSADKKIEEHPLEQEQTNTQEKISHNVSTNVNEAAQQEAEPNYAAQQSVDQQKEKESSPKVYQKISDPKSEIQVPSKEMQQLMRTAKDTLQK